MKGDTAHSERRGGREQVVKDFIYQNILNKDRLLNIFKGKSYSAKGGKKDKGFIPDPKKRDEISDKGNDKNKAYARHEDEKDHSYADTDEYLLFLSYIYNDITSFIESNKEYYLQNLDYSDVEDLIIYICGNICRESFKNIKTMFNSYDNMKEKETDKHVKGEHIIPNSNLHFNDSSFFFIPPMEFIVSHIIKLSCNMTEGNITTEGRDIYDFVKNNNYDKHPILNGIMLEEPTHLLGDMYSRDLTDYVIKSHEDKEKTPLQQNYEHVKGSKQTKEKQQTKNENGNYPLEGEEYIDIPPQYGEESPFVLKTAVNNEKPPHLNRSKISITCNEQKYDSKLCSSENTKCITKEDLEICAKGNVREAFDICSERENVIPRRNGTCTYIDIENIDSSNLSNMSNLSFRKSYSDGGHVNGERKKREVEDSHHTVIELFPPVLSPSQFYEPGENSPSGITPLGEVAAMEGEEMDAEKAVNDVGKGAYVISAKTYTESNPGEKGNSARANDLDADTNDNNTDYDGDDLSVSGEIDGDESVGRQINIGCDTHCAPDEDIIGANEQEAGSNDVSTILNRKDEDTATNVKGSEKGKVGDIVGEIRFNTMHGKEKSIIGNANNDSYYHLKETMKTMRDLSNPQVLQVNDTISKSNEGEFLSKRIIEFNRNEYHEKLQRVLLKEKYTVKEKQKDYTKNTNLHDDYYYFNYLNTSEHISNPYRFTKISRKANIQVTPSPFPQFLRDIQICNPSRKKIRLKR
ncbi:conserved Plasmodium protein, unknown function [Plasmodium ovale wallikeri]|uniref:Uncharacterized protein n=1 Tax=Plasmodium ovale wallikeri TaxID=864142 RepID=A0A1A8YUQ6_PLAOA|nr:conserved Plasmodium protein, unknown function [Plasmodium ovale wallikeri]SBT35361.1 conserved Plasmodium protein, unknown function [Plasmodium ovale wallikeri]